MNVSGSHRNDETLVNTGYWEGSRPQGISETRRGNLLSGKTGNDSRRGAPSGTAALIIKGVWGHQPPSSDL